MEKDEKKEERSDDRNREENRKKKFFYRLKPPVWLQFRNGADTGFTRQVSRALARHS